jgi:hypothetical protein
MTMSESEKFDATVRKVLSVSHEELKRREAEWKRQRERTKKKRAKDKKR